MARSEAFARFPEHTITIQPEPRRVRVRAGGEIVAETADALRLDEARYAPCYYVPRKDVRMELLERSDHTTHCPFKGDAAYYTLRVGGREEPNAVWTYEAPFDEVEAIREHLAFYTDRVELELLA